MSDRHPPSGPPGGHPDEALAGFVEGTASDEERRLVEAHLRTCASCRAEVGLARASLAAVATIPEAEGPGLDAAAIAETARTVVPISTRSEAPAAGSRRSAARWLGLVGGLAAASIAGLLVFGLLHSPGGGSSSTGALAPGTESAVPNQSAGASQTVPTPGTVQPSVPTSIVTNQDFTTAAVAQFARNVASGSRLFFTRSPNANGASSTDVAAATLCARGAAGTADNPVLIVRARFEGRPSFVTAFRSQQTGDVRVVVTPVGACRVLYQTRSPGAGSSPGG
jgi:hypothetical protein